MRLRRLDLTRYGRFTGHVLDFGPRGEGPDLHVVYGPNEAGKSTALSAFLDLLYGIEMRSPYNFLHPYETMQIGAALDWDGAVSDWVRVKANRNSLRDGHGQPVGDHALAAMLGGIDRTAYRGMFSLDDDTLEQGGEDILKSEGDLGQLLFAASAGLSDLARTLDDLKAEAERFHKDRARATELADLKRDLDALDKERREIDVQASDYARRKAARDQAAQAYEAAVAAVGAATARMEEIDRLRQALDHQATRTRLGRELEAFADLPEPPPAWSEDIGPLRDEDTRLTTEREGLDRQIDRLDQEIKGMAVDEAVLALGERIDRLRETEGRYTTAAEDLPRRRLERTARDAEIAAVLAQLDRPGEADARALVLPASTVGTLRGLIAQRSGVAEKREAAQTEHDKATARLGAAQADLAHALGGPAGHQPDPDPTPWRVLEAAVHDIRRDTSETAVLLETRARDGLAEALDDALVALAPWSGDAETLASLAVPDAARLEAWKQALAEADKALDAQAGEIARLDGECARLAAEMDAVRRTTGVVDDETAAARRAARDAAWAMHRADLTPETADAFETAMRADDAATGGRLAQTTEVARLRQAAIDLASTRETLVHARAQRDAIQARRDAVCQDLAAVLAALGLPADWPPSSLADWLARREAALRARADLRAKDRQIRDLRDDAHRARDRLAAALTAVGAPAPPDASLSSLLDTADGALKRHADQSTRLENRRKALTEAEQEVADRTRALNAAVAADAAWRSDWDAALAGCWLGADGARPAPEAVGAMLDGLDTLKGVLDRRDDTDHRIAQMDRDQRAYVQALSEVLAELGETLDPAHPLQAADALAARLTEARSAAEKRADRRQRLDQARTDRAALDAPLDAVARRKAEMTALFGVETLAEVDAALKRAAHRDSLRADIAAAERAVITALRVSAPPEADAMLAAADPEALDRERSDLDARREDLETTRMAARDALTRATDALAAVGGDDDVARLEARRRTLLLEIEDKARRHLSLRLGIAAATRALALYQERHRSSMLARAADAFATISRGAYANLTVVSDPGGEKLVALDAAGGSKRVAALSKGTRFQLYLALRVAGYHEFAARTAPVPFVADDIMETFDDFRAEEAFRLFAGMAEVGQVIYLTHHRHLCDIAREVCPAVRVQSLETPEPG
ncbi:AAA family ATPase [uncultured Rhodospira sp.]|uniref:ATP-binding protein n=1 Tax=uncultured Rhodospira sp. TaxID=1936189 RepID=UPI00260D2941|nr:AAA family ATPase [uncultured Rhodospira sp.]